MNYEFDPKKSQSNKLKHGIDFEEAQILWDDPKRVLFVARFDDEERFGVIALRGTKLWCAIYTERHDAIRIISVRRARQYEEETYYNSKGI
jgi:uncharacterized DUF497 family protein